jgi:hypothetical protein
VEKLALTIIWTKITNIFVTEVMENLEKFGTYNFFDKMTTTYVIQRNGKSSDMAFLLK